MSRLAFAVFIAILAANATVASEQAYPSKPIRMIVPYAPGGGTDVLARLLGRKMSDALGQAVVVDNRAGAGGIVGTELAARAPADGYTLLMISSAHTIVSAMGTSTPYDPVKDFAPVSLLTAQPYLMVVHPSVPAATLKEFIALARSRAGQLNYGSGGIGTAPHLAGELLKSATGIALTHVPYKGGGPALSAVVSGEISMLFASLPTTLPQAQASKVRVLAISSLKRNRAAPSVPTLAESGIPNFEVVNWYGLLAPTRTPQRIIERVQQLAARLLRAPDVEARLLADGTEAIGDTPAQFRAYLEAELAKWKQLVRTTGMQAQEPAR